jgi:Ca2+-binding EF-hand superfamily protein
MGALDYTMKILAENKVAMTKHDFRDKMMASDQLGMIPEKELDLLFGALDITKDGFISTNDFRSLADLGRKVNLEIQSDGDGK